MKYNDQGKKWLRVKNWEEYQPSGKLFKKDARLPWIKDYTDKLANVEYQKLPCVARYLYEGICLIVGDRPERTLPNDPAWIAQRLHIRRAEHSHIPRTLTTLVEHGFIIPIETEKISDDGEETGSKKAEEIGEGEGREENEQLVSQLVSECSTQTQNFEALSDGSKTIIECLYPRVEPEFGSIQPHMGSLEEVAPALTVSGWKEFFEWNRTHKPEPLIFRSLPQFLAGIRYAINDYTVHDLKTCRVCKPKEKGAKA